MKCTKHDIEIIEKILSEEKPADKEKINELRSQIYEELHKPDDEMDCDLIDENIRTLFLLEDGEYENHIDAEKELEKARKKAEAAQPKLKRILQYKFMKHVLAACLTFVFLLTANAIAVQATGNNLLDSVVRLGKNYIGFDFTKRNSQSPNIQGEIGENNALYQELLEKCNEYDLSPLLPKSLPQNFTIINFEEQNFEIRKVLTIQLGNETDSVLLHIDYYYDPKSIPEIKTPNTSDYEKMTIQGNDIYLVKTGNAYVAMLKDGNYVYNINSKISYDKTVDLLNSMNH